MKTVEVISRDERSVWAQRVKELKEHNTWSNKKQYFPNNIDEWEKEGNEIVYKYNIKLQELNKERKICEKLKEIGDNEEQKLQIFAKKVKNLRIADKSKKTRTENKNKPNTRRSARLIAKSLTDDTQIAANALLELKNYRK